MSSTKHNGGVIWHYARSVACDTQLCLRKQRTSKRQDSTRGVKNRAVTAHSAIARRSRSLRSSNRRGHKPLCSRNSTGRRKKSGAWREVDAKSKATRIMRSADLPQARSGGGSPLGQRRGNKRVRVVAMESQGEEVGEVASPQVRFCCCWRTKATAAATS